MLKKQITFTQNHFSQRISFHGESESDEALPNRRLHSSMYVPQYGYCDLVDMGKHSVGEKA
jgi:hypothetical protein